MSTEQTDTPEVDLGHAAPNQTFLQRIHFIIWFPPCLMTGVCLLGIQFNYLLFHMAAELLSIIIAFTALIVATLSRRFTKNLFTVYLATVIGWCASLDFLHTLVYKGMSLINNDNANPSIQLWVVARLIQDLALVFSPLLLTRHIRIGLIHLILATLVLGSLATIWLGIFPPMYIEGIGLSQLKISLEYFIIGLLTLTLFLYWKNRTYMSSALYGYLSLSVLAMIFSEFAFTQYASVYGPANLVGHVLKIFAYWFIYIALVDSTLSKPFSMLARASTSFDSVPDPTIVVSNDGAILQANIAASNLTSVPAEELVERKSHELFHDLNIRPEDCPVCLKLKNGILQFKEVLRFKESERVVECNVSPFLSENSHPASVQVIRDITEQDKANKQIQNLTYLYEMLSNTNRAIVHCSRPDELLAAVFDALVKGNAFPMLFIALNNDGEPPLRIVHAHGFSVEKISDLTNTLANVDSPLNQLIHSAGIDQIIDAPLPSSDEDDWIDYLRGEGITSRAVMLLKDVSKTVGVLTIYSKDLNAFDEKQHQLLQQMASDISFALAGMRTESRREIAEARAIKSEHRFSQIFESSPTPVQIFKVGSNEILAINIAFKQWLGYDLESIKNEEVWLEKYVLNAEGLSKLRKSWAAAIENASENGTQQASPEVQIRASNGSIKTAVAAMRLIGDEAIVAWTDLTEIRSKEAALVESERHFRDMIEQSVAGIYVRRNGFFIYVNSRYSTITGWNRDELINHSVLEFTVNTQENLKIIHAAWEKLDAGAPEVTYSVPFKHKNGTIIDLELHAKIIDWDGTPAHIVLVDDITERERHAEQIRKYVGELEAAMKGTLGAVSTMVEMRDPYTAGHERRVGLIARDIALEMGWPEERAKSLEMIGLVHDIGKISLPAEILTKPSRLSPIEVELVRTHAEAGYQILKDIPFPIPLAEIVREHHERLDGSGYPQGLKGDQILPEARILAVADVIESMASHRPYRPALGIEVALEELIKNRGALYDSEVVDAISRLVRNKAYLLPN